MKVLVTGILSRVFFEILENHKMITVDVRLAISKSGLLNLIDKYDVIITRSETSVDREIIEKAKNLKAIIRAAVGTDNIDIEYASHKGILVINCPFDNVVSTAEHTLALMFATARNIPHADAALKIGLWKRELYIGIELHGKTIGIIGLGKVGGRVAELANSIGMSVIAYDPYILPEQFKKQGAVRIKNLNQLLSRADVISIHTPKTNETCNMIDEEELKLTKDGVIIINCARGGIINENALVTMLDTGHVYAAGIDVWEKEPAIDTVLQKHPRVVSTPHIGASTIEGQARIARTAAEQLLKVFNGEIVDYPVNLPPKSARNEMSSLII
jgi:D-3-phosphoglycerate dehydrogenase